MASSSDLKDICPSPPTGAFSGDQVAFGVPIPKQKRLEILDEDEWEAFIEEWATSLKKKYTFVRRYSGAGDQGLDVVGLLASEQLADGYVNYQCKHYNHALSPSDIWLELGKLVYYTWRGDYPVPRQYRFAAPRGIGTKLNKLFRDAAALKAGLKQNWEKYCQDGITDQESVVLEGAIVSHLEELDFSIVGSVSTAELIEGHSTTPFHSVRFGGGLPARPQMEVPVDIQPEETRYTEQLFEAYSDNAKIEVTRQTVAGTEYEPDFKRQRERFYSAESLKNFARDSVPPGTFEELQDQAFDAVFDVAQSAHSCGLTRMRAVMNQVSLASFSSSPLISRIKEQDKKGMCHQLANEDRLKWVP